jgi:hypothetical protein
MEALHGSDPALCRPLLSRVRGGSREGGDSLNPGRLAVELLGGGGSAVAGRRRRRAKHGRLTSASARNPRTESRRLAGQVRRQYETNVEGEQNTTVRAMRSSRCEAGIRTHQKD